MIKVNRKSAKGISKLKIIRELISSRKPFYKSIWTAREKIYNHQQNPLDSWKSFAECVPEIGASQNVSKQEQFVASLLYNMERLKVSTSEKQVIKKEDLDALQTPLIKAIKRFNSANSQQYFNLIKKAFNAFSHRREQNIFVSDRAIASNSKNQNSFRPVLVQCKNDECLFVGEGLQEKQYLNFDLLVSFGNNKKWLVAQYVKAFRKIQKNYNEPLTLCFRKKYAGAEGVIQLRKGTKRIKGITDKLSNNPVVIYSQTLDKIESPSDTKNEKCVLFGDIVITGCGVTTWLKRMVEYGYSVCGIIIFAEYGNKQKVKDYPKNLITKIEQHISKNNLKPKKLNNVYEYDQLCGRFVEPEVEDLFIPKTLKEAPKVLQFKEKMSFDWPE